MNAPADFIHAMFRELRDQIGGLQTEMMRRFDRVDSEFRDVKNRLDSVEHHMTGVHLDLHRQNERLGEFDRRIERIERRLDLRDAN